MMQELRYSIRDRAIERGILWRSRDKAREVVSLLFMPFAAMPETPYGIDVQFGQTLE